MIKFKLYKHYRNGSIYASIIACIARPFSELLHFPNLKIIRKCLEKKVFTPTIEYQARFAFAKEKLCRYELFFNSRLFRPREKTEEKTLETFVATFNKTLDKNTTNALHILKVKP